MKDMPLYSRLLMEHYHRPVYYGRLDGASFVGTSTNQACGDVVTFYGSLKDDYLVLVAHEGSGCIVSQACASLLAEHVLGKTSDYIRALLPRDIAQLVGLECGPQRMKCVSVALEALLQGVRNHAQSN